MQSNTRNKSREHLLALVEGALMVALAVALDLIPWKIKWPNGGSFSIAAVPIIYYAFRRGSAWGLGAGAVFSGIQIILGLYLPPAKTVTAVVLCLLLDYIVAFTVYGAADFVARPLSHGSDRLRLCGYAAGALAVSAARFLCSFLSGILLWQDYAPEGTPVWIYSLVYNGGYMLPNGLVGTVCVVLLCLAADPRTLRRMRPGANKNKE